MCPTEDDEYYPTTLFGARLIGIEGWVVREEPMTLPQIEEITPLVWGSATKA